MNHLRLAAHNSYLNSPLSLTTSGTRPTDSSLVRGNSTNVRLLDIILIELMFYRLAAEFSRLRSAGIAQDIERMREYAYDTHTTGQAHRDPVPVRAVRSSEHGRIRAGLLPYSWQRPSAFPVYQYDKRLGALLQCRLQCNGPGGRMESRGSAAAHPPLFSGALSRILRVISASPKKNAAGVSTYVAPSYQSAAAVSAG